MLLRIIGVECKSGSFTPQSNGQVIDYNNIYLYGVRTLSQPADGRLCSGEIPETIKIKNDSAFVRGVFNCEMSSQDYLDMIGNEYNVYFDNHNRVDMITPYASPASKKGA